MPARTDGSADRPTGRDRVDLESRVQALESQVERLASLLDTSSQFDRPSLRDRPSRRDTSPTPDPTPPPVPAPQQPGPPEPPSDRDALWALTALQDRLPPPGGVVFAGSVSTDAGHAQFQWGRPLVDILDADWAERAETVGALGHPLRLTLLQQLVNGPRTVAQLVDELELGSTGVAYHHLNALHSGGWVTSPRRGTWAVPASRVVPLLTILIALENG